MSFEQARKGSLSIITIRAARETASIASPRWDSGFADVPVLTLADSQRDAKDMASVFQVGASDYLVQPFQPSLLRARLRSGLLRARSV